MHFDGQVSLQADTWQICELISGGWWHKATAVQCGYSFMSWLMVCSAAVIQIVAFLDKLNELRSMTPMAASMCREMNKLYKLDEAKNCEIRCSWYKV